MPMGPYIMLLPECIEKRRIVDDKVDQDNFVSRMGQVAHETEMVIYAWVH